MTPAATTGGMIIERRASEGLGALESTPELRPRSPALEIPLCDRVRPLLDEAWFVHLADDERRRRMVARHVRHGHPLADAEARTLGNDERNAVLVNAAPNRPDLWIEQVW